MVPRQLGQNQHQTIDVIHQNLWIGHLPIYMARGQFKGFTKLYLWQILAWKFEFGWLMVRKIYKNSSKMVLVLAQNFKCRLKTRFCFHFCQTYQCENCSNIFRKKDQLLKHNAFVHEGYCDDSCGNYQYGSWNSINFCIQTNIHSPK